MATVTIDELVVKLGLDPTNFTKGQAEALTSFKATQEAAKRTATQMEADGKQAARFYTNIKNEALSAIAVLVGARDIGKFIGDTVTNLSAVGRIATVMGQATPDVIAVGMAVERIGGNAAAAQQNMLALSQSLERYSRFGEGSIEFKRGLGMIGAGPSDTPLQVLQKFATWSQGKKAQDVELIGGQIGLNQDLINETIQGRGKFDSDIAQSYKNGIPTDADIKKVTALQVAFNNLAQSLKFAGTELVVDVADPLTHLFDTVTGLIHQFPELTKVILATVAALITLKGLGVGADVIRTLTGGGAAAGGAATAEAGGGAAATAAGGVGIGAIVGAVGGGVALSLVPTEIGHEDSPAAHDVDSQIAALQSQLAGPDLGTRPYLRKRIAELQAKRASMGTQASAGTGGPARGGRGLSAAGRDALAYLAAHGIDPQTALGIGAGITAEGGAFGARDQFDRKGSYAFGIEQLRGSRQRDLFAKYGKNPTKEQELAFLLSDLTGGGDKRGPEVLATNGAHAAMVAYVTALMRPGSGLAGDIRRGDAAIGGTSVHIDTIVVQTQATDARGVARGLRRELSQQLAANANTGPN